MALRQLRKRRRTKANNFKPLDIIGEIERTCSLPLPKNMADCAREIELLADRQRLLGKLLQELYQKSSGYLDLDKQDSSSSVEKIPVVSDDWFNEDIGSPSVIRGPQDDFTIDNRESVIHYRKKETSVCKISSRHISERFSKSLNSRFGEAIDTTHSSPLIIAMKKLQVQHQQRITIKDCISNLVRLFRLADVDKSETIDPEEYVWMVEKLDVSEQLKSSLYSKFETIDENNSGHINIREFLNFFLVFPEFNDELLRHAHHNAPFLYEKGLSKSQKWRLWLYNLVEVPRCNALSKTIFFIDCILAIIPAVAVFAQGVRPSYFVDWKENVYLWIINIFFLLQYLCGLLMCKSPLRYVTDIWHIIDFISFAFWIMYNTFLNPGSLDPSGFVIFRTLRVLKITSVFNFQTLREDLAVYDDTLRLAYTSYETVAGFMLYLIVFFSILIYVFERGTYDIDTNTWVRDIDEGESPFSNIYNCFYFTGVTMTTVGYGDCSPKSDVGKLVALMSACCGVCNITLLINIIGECFEEVFREYVVTRSKKIEAKRVEYIQKHINWASKSFIADQVKGEMKKVSGSSMTENYAPFQNEMLSFHSLSEPINTKQKDTEKESIERSATGRQLNIKHLT